MGFRLALAVGAFLLGTLCEASAANTNRFFRIGTAGTVGIYFPIGGLIASAISRPPGSRPCEKGGSCGVDGLIALAVSTNGSVANVRGVAEGVYDSAFAQSDVIYWAYTGTGLFDDEEERLDSLRVVANLYPESIHLVTRRDSDIESVEDLRGKTVSLDEEGSGTLVDALFILEAYGLGPDDVEAVHLNAPAAGAALLEGKIDAFFFVGGYPNRVVAQMASEDRIRLVPIAGPEARELREQHPFLARDSIPAGVYPNIGRTPTLSVNAQWIVDAELEDELVYGITRALWHPTTAQMLAQGHPMGRFIRLDNALDGVAIPLHPGAERYYREAGLLDDSEEGGAQDERVTGEDKR
jgi:uncharacterized protein